MRGTIENRKDGTSTKGDPYVTYTIGGQKYSTFKFLEFQTGDEVEFTWTQKGNYKNLVTAEPYAPKPDQNVFIIREVCVKAAAEVASPQLVGRERCQLALWVDLSSV